MVEDATRGASTPGLPPGDVRSVPSSGDMPWQQVLAVSVVGILLLLLFRIGGVPVVLAGIFTFLDASKSGIRKTVGSKSFLNLSAAGWAIAVMGLTIVAYPCYLFARSKLVTKPGPVVFWVLANVFSVLALALAALGVVALTKRAG